MGVIVHSSLRSLGHVEGGAQTVVEALMEIITPEGTLVMPSFNHDVPFREGGPGYYHPHETPTTNGAIPDCFWRMDGVHRSLNPTHPFAAWGKHARRYTEFHHRTLTMGPESPLGLLLRMMGTACCWVWIITRIPSITPSKCPRARRAWDSARKPIPWCCPMGGAWWGGRGVGVMRRCPLTDAGRYVPAMADVHRQAIGRQGTVHVLPIARLLQNQSPMC